MSEQMIPMVQPKRVLVRSSVNNEYKIRLARPITEIDDFEEEIMALEEASENDVVFMQLSSPGGSLETCDFICRRMEECRAPIIVEIGLTCASAASAMCLHADDWIIHDSSTMMIHACSYSPGYGKEVDIRRSAENTARINKEWVIRVYQGFLTEDELDMVLDGKDLYFYADDLRERLPKYKSYRNSLKSGIPDDVEFEEISLDEIVAKAVEEGSQKVIDRLLKKFDLVAKAAKPARKKIEATTSGKIDPVVVENVEAFNKFSETMNLK